MGVNCNYIISNGLKTNKWWGEEKNKFWMRVHRNCYNWNGWKQTNGEEWKTFSDFSSPIPSSTLPSWRTMPPRGRTTSPWWTHFQSVEGCTYLKDSFYSESLGDFRLAKCLHCEKNVKVASKQWRSGTAVELKLGTFLPINAFTKALQVCGLHWLACATYKWSLKYRWQII